jgi:N-acetyl-alpha-D-glucosaminyl L-malate synthase BshA
VSVVWIFEAAYESAGSMKIGITCYPTYGGSGAVATALGLELARNGHQVHFISYAQPFRLTQFKDGVYFHEVKPNQYPLFEYPPYSLALAVTMHEVVRREELDLLHVHYALPHATAGWIAREMLRASGRDVKLVTTLHGTDITLVGQDPSYWSIVRFSIEKSDRLTAVSRWLCDRTYQDFQCEQSAIDVIPNFVDTDVYDRERYVEKHVFGSPDERILMHISNFRRVKRIPDVIKIFHRVQSELPARLVLVGDGPERQAAEDLAERLDIADRVVILGKIEAVAELLASADLFLLPSEQESFGLGALEAQASGVPVIGSERTGLAEVVEDGVTGSLHAVGDIDAMAEAAISLLTDKDRWTAVSQASRARAVATFATSRVVPKYEKLYREVLGLPEPGDTLESDTS